LFVDKNNLTFMDTILLHTITTDELFSKIREIIKEELKSALQQDQLLTKEGALKMTGISNATFLKAINDGLVKPQLVKGRKKAMYLESEILKIEGRRRKPSVN
jgi:predicted DNA-binding transcriptional regulator AlpA